MNKIEFKDYPDLTTPINANILNQMQDNIANAISTNSTDISNLENDVAAVERDITTINNNINVIESDITSVETNTTILTNRVNNLEITKGLPVYEDGYIDCNTTTEYFILSQKNTPNDSLYFVLTLFFGGKTATANRTQIAIPYNYSAGTTKNTVYSRYYFNGAWTTWRLINS